MSLHETKTILQSTDYYRKRILGVKTVKYACSVPHCGAVVYRLDTHMRKIHKLLKPQLHSQQLVECTVTRAADHSISLEFISLNSNTTEHESDRAMEIISLESISLNSNTTEHESDRAMEIISLESISLISDSVGDVNTTHRESSKAMEINPSINQEERESTDIGGTVAASSSLESVVGSFQMFLKSMDGGRMRGSDGYVLSVKQILSKLGSDISNLTKDTVRSLYFEPLLKTSGESGKRGKVLSCKTLRNKLCALKHFCKFLSRDDCMVSSNVKINVKKILESLPGWSYSMRDLCSAQDALKSLNDLDCKITPSDCSKYLSSNYAQNAADLLQKSNNIPLCDVDFWKCRNHVILVLCLANAHRSGVLCNFTLTDYDRGLQQSSENSSDIVFHVASHKTASVYGPATIACDTDEAQLLASYIKIRKLVKTTQQYVFVTNNGNRLTQSCIASGMSAAFKGACVPKRVSCTKIRKAAVTAVYSTNPDKKSELASHMCHRATTAARSYLMIEKTSNSVQISEIIRNALAQKKRYADDSGSLSALEASSSIDASTRAFETSNTVADVSRTKQYACSTGSLVAVNGSYPIECSAPEFEISNSVAEVCDDVFVLPKNVYASPKVEPYRRIWSMENRDLVRNMFPKMVKSNSAPTADIEKILLSKPEVVAKLQKDLNKSNVHALAVAIRLKLLDANRNKKKVQSFRL
jgi:hypothetical protein